MVDEIARIIPPVVTHEFIGLLNSVAASSSNDTENAKKIACLLACEYADIELTALHRQPPAIIGRPVTLGWRPMRVRIHRPPADVRRFTA